MIETARSSALHALRRAEHLLGHAEAAGLLEARLAEGMFTFENQIATAASMARRSVLVLAGVETAHGPYAKGAEGLRARIETARADIRACEAPELSRVAHRAGFADLDQSAEEYVARFALPNLWFHVSMAYAILRVNGVGIGKADFDGLHRYPEGFAFED